MSRSSTTMTDEELLPNPHPGEILKQEFLDEIGPSQDRLASDRSAGIILVAA